MTLTGCMMNNSASESKDKPIKVEQKNKKIKQIKAKYQVVEHDWNVYKDGVNIYGRIYVPKDLAGHTD